MSADADDHVCEISYRLDTDVGVWYEFHTSAMPLSGVIDFDRELRRRIAEAEVSDYWWPVFPASRPRDPQPMMRCPAIEAEGVTIVPVAAAVRLAAKARKA